jgi:hypothetical protein
MSNSKKDYIVIDDSELFDIPEDIEKEFEKKIKELEKKLK